jgi:hypothetical protein
MVLQYKLLNQSKVLIRCTVELISSGRQAVKYKNMLAAAMTASSQQVLASNTRLGLQQDKALRLSLASNPLLLPLMLNTACTSATISGLMRKE